MQSTTDTRTVSRTRLEVASASVQHSTEKFRLDFVSHPIHPTSWLIQNDSRGTGRIKSQWMTAVNCSLAYCVLEVQECVGLALGVLPVLLGNGGLAQQALLHWTLAALHLRGSSADQLLESSQKCVASDSRELWPFVTLQRLCFCGQVRTENRVGKRCPPVHSNVLLTRCGLLSFPKLSSSESRQEVTCQESKGAPGTDDFSGTAV